MSGLLVLTPKELMVLDQRLKNSCQTSSELRTRLGELMLRVGSGLVAIVEKEYFVITLIIYDDEIWQAIHVIDSFTAVGQDIIGLKLLVKLYKLLLPLPTLEVEEALSAGNENNNTNESTTDDGTRSEDESRSSLSNPKGSCDNGDTETPSIDDYFS